MESLNLDYMTYLFPRKKKNRPIRKKHLGYIIKYAPEHSRSNNIGYVFEHILIAEKIRGKKLPPKAVIHHPFGKKDNNEKIVICENQGYHLFLHTRERAYMACGNVHWRKCRFCQKYDDINNLNLHRRSYYHKKCMSKQ